MPPILVKVFYPNCHNCKHFVKNEAFPHLSKCKKIVKLETNVYEFADISRYTPGLCGTYGKYFELKELIDFID